MAEELNLDMQAFSTIPPTTRSANYQTVYANGAKIGMSPWDLRITFSHSIEGNPGIVNEEQVTVVMSPQQAKAVLHNWALTIKSYEQMFGEMKDIQGILREAQQSAPQNLKKKKS